MTRVTSFPHRRYEQHSMSAISKLSIEVSNLHVGENGVLEIGCQATIPDFLRRQAQYADIRTKSITGEKYILSIAYTRHNNSRNFFFLPYLIYIVDITVAPTPTSSSNQNLPRGLTPILLLLLLSILSTAMHKINP